MTQIDKILPSKEEVDELFRENKLKASFNGKNFLVENLAKLPKGLDQRPEPIILVGNKDNAKTIIEALK